MGVGNDLYYELRRPMGQWIACLLPKPRARVRIPGEAWILQSECCPVGGTHGSPTGCPFTSWPSISATPRAKKYRSRASPLDKKKYIMNCKNEKFRYYE